MPRSAIAVQRLCPVANQLHLHPVLLLVVLVAVKLKAVLLVRWLVRSQLERVKCHILVSDHCLS